ncbi:hypothetical protein GU700_17800 [Methylobacterium sp. NI91]|nr:hypothetical protein GU700_17800 [Methylobacterium sp. NI91]
MAGGIGITPLVAMARAPAKGGDFILHFCARSAAEAPLLDALRTVCGDRLQLWFSGAGRCFKPALIGPPTPARTCPTPSCRKRDFVRIC